MTAITCTLVTVALTILAAVLGLVIEYKLEPLHRAREARRWAERVRQDEINSRRDAHERNMARLARQLDDDRLASTLARDALRAMCDREGVKPRGVQIKPRAALFMPPAELGQH